MNVQPYGMEWHKPVSRLEEAIRVMKLLWSTDKPVDFDGEFFQLRDAVLGPLALRGPDAAAVAGRARPADAAHHGRHADGWLPTNIRPDAYAEKLAAIRESAEKAGRDPDAIVPSMLAYVICAPDEESLERMCNSPMARVLFAAVDLPAETYERHGSTSPSRAGRAFTPSSRRGSRARRSSTNIKPDAYAEKLAAIHESAEAAGRDPDAITPSMLAYVICAPDEETLERVCEAPLARLLFAAVDLPAEPRTSATARRRRSRAARAFTRSSRPGSTARRPSGSSRTSPAGSCASTRSRARRR